MDNNYIIIALMAIIAVLLLKKNRENFEIQTDNKIAMSYVINLETDKDRFKILKRQLKHANLPYTRFEAILGKNVSKNDPLYKFYFSEKGKEKLKPAQIGCSLSHIYLWNKISKEPKNNVYLVLEDDAVVPVDFNYRLNTYMKQLPDDWEMLLLGCNMTIGSYYSSNWIHKRKKIRKNGNYGLYGYVLRPYAAKKLLKICEGMDTTIDHYLDKNYYLNNPVYIATPSIIQHNFSFYSNIFEKRRTADEKRANSVRIV